MLEVSFKSVCNLLEKYYQRRSLNTFVYGEDMPENAFEASKVFAMQGEDYNYLSVMATNKDNLDAGYVLFIDKIVDNLPFVLEKDKDLNLAQVAGLSIDSPRIDKKFFEDIVEAQAEGKSIDADHCKKAFNYIRNAIIKAQEDSGNAPES